MELTEIRLHWAIPAFLRARSKALSSETVLVAFPLVVKNSFGIISVFYVSFLMYRNSNNSELLILPWRILVSVYTFEAKLTIFISNVL